MESDNDKETTGISRDFQGFQGFQGLHLLFVQRFVFS